MVMIEHAGSVIKNVPIYLTKGDNRLKRITEGMLGRDHQRNAEGQGAPAYLYSQLVSKKHNRLNWAFWWHFTAVTVSMHSTKGSDVKYLESDQEYSFHICPKRSCLPGILA